MSKETVEVNHYWHLEHDVSFSFNRLKAKLYNLIEASINDREQSQAVKGLIRGFANDEYVRCIESMRHTARMAEFIEKEAFEDIPPMTAEPLESSHL